MSLKIVQHAKFYRALFIYLQDIQWQLLVLTLLPKAPHRSLTVSFEEQDHKVLFLLINAIQSSTNFRRKCSQSTNPRTEN